MNLLIIVNTGISFDSCGILSYDCALMFSRPLPTKVNLTKLSEQGAQLSGYIPLLNLQRFVKLLVAEQCQSAKANIGIKFSRDQQRRCLLDIEINATVPVTCQRCLDTVEIPIDIDTRWLCVNSETDIDTIEFPLETIVVDSDFVDISPWIEDELIVSLPMVSKHDGNCASKYDYLVVDDNLSDSALAGNSQDRTADRQRPFAILKQLKNKV